LMSDYSSLRRLVTWLDGQLPADPVAPVAPVAPQAPAAVAVPAAVPAQAPNNALPTPFAGMALSNLAPSGVPAMPASAGNEVLIQQVIQQQMQVMSQQLAMLSGVAAQPAPVAAAVAQPAPVQAAPAPAVPAAAPAPVPAAATAAADADADTDADAEEGSGPQAKYDVQKSFGAIARIHTARQALSPRQQDKLRAFIERYVARTRKSKAYTQENRAQMADPRVASGFRPQYKEIVYQTVMARSKGSRLWDIDGNEYIDANNGFGMSLFGWQPDF